MGKRARVFSLAMLLCISALAGCRGPEPGPTEPSIGPTAPEASTEAPADATSGTAPSEAPGTVPSLPESSASAIEPSRLADFDQRLSVLGATSSEEFCANYQEALALYEAGLRPEAAMPTYDPTGVQPDPGDFYRAKLDPDVYGVSQFFVLPVGERSLTVEEYLELVEASGVMAAQDLILPENSWFSTQESRIEACIPSSSRSLYPSERFWLPYLLGMHYQDQELPAEDNAAPALYLPLPAEGGSYTVYPSGHLSPQGVLADGLHALSLLPTERQASYIPPADTDFEAIKSAAIQALRDHMGLSADPISVYCACPDAGSPPFDSPDFVWDVGLLYSRGASYLVGLKPQDLSLAYIMPLSGGDLVLSRDWSLMDAQS